MQTEEFPELASAHHAPPPERPTPRPRAPPPRPALCAAPGVGFDASSTSCVPQHTVVRRRVPCPPCTPPRDGLVFKIKSNSLPCLRDSQEGAHSPPFPKKPRPRHQKASHPGPAPPHPQVWEGCPPHRPAAAPSFPGVCPTPSIRLTPPCLLGTAHLPKVPRQSTRALVSHLWVPGVVRTPTRHS